MSEPLFRCHWCESHPLLTEYHDSEWGAPNHSQIHLYEHFILEIFQAGLNWLTMLKKRANFKSAFAGFDPEKIAMFNEADIDRLMNDAGIIRNKNKILAGVHNAVSFMKISEEFDGFWNFAVRFRAEKEIVYRVEKEIPPQTPESAAFAKELKTHGFKFIGPTSAYAYMQGVGLVNDHIESCFRFHKIREMQKLK